MKQHIVKTLLLITLTLFIFNCEKDDVNNTNVEVSKQQIYSPFKISKIDKEKVLSNTNIKNKLEKISNSIEKKSTSKEVVSSEYGFTIDTEQAVYIENNETSYHSYTFPIHRTSETGVLENLLLSLQPDGSYKSFIISYNVTTQEKKDIANGLVVNLENKVSTTEIDDAGLIIDILSKATECIEIVAGYCSYGNHVDGYLDDGSNCPGYTEDIIASIGDCGSPGGDPSNTNNNNTNDTTDNSTSDTTNNNNSTNNQTNNGGADPTITDVTAPVVLQPWQQIVSCLNTVSETGNNGFTPEMSAWLQIQPEILQNQINDYIKQNQCSQNAQEFAIQSIYTLMNDGEVDFVEELILDSDLKDNDCLYSVYTAMGKARTFANYLNNFDGSMSVANLKLTSSTSLPSNTNAETSPPQNYLITITFNENNLDRPNLSIARTFIHEMIHAEIFRKLLSVAQHPSIQLDQNQIIQLRNDYPGLYDYYMRWQWDIPQGQSPSGAQHEAMAQHYRDIIAQTLREYDNSQIDSVYEAFAWVGLQNTVAWNNLSQDEKDNIIQTIVNFNANNPNCQ